MSKSWKSPSQHHAEGLFVSGPEETRTPDFTLVIAVIAAPMIANRGYDPRILRLVRANLEKVGFVVSTAAGGAAALEQFWMRARKTS
jgi:hypothetical protein